LLVWIFEAELLKLFFLFAAAYILLLQYPDLCLVLDNSNAARFGSESKVKLFL
jgi:hypothetical protein